MNSTKVHNQTDPASPDYLISIMATNIQSTHTSDEPDSSSSYLDDRNLYIKGLWKGCTQIELDDLFREFGVISQSRVYKNGTGFVRYQQGDQAKAVKCYHKVLNISYYMAEPITKFAFLRIRPTSLDEIC